MTALIDIMDAAHTARSALIFMRYVRREIAVQFEALPSMVRGADIIVAASLCFGLASMAEAMQISYRFIAVQICTEKKSYRQKARLVGQEIRRGDGVQQTIQAIFASH